MEARKADEIIVQKKGQDYSQLIIQKIFKNPLQAVATIGTAIILILFIIMAIWTVLK